MILKKPLQTSEQKLRKISQIFGDIVETLSQIKQGLAYQQLSKFLLIENLQDKNYVKQRLEALEYCMKELGNITPTFSKVDLSTSGHIKKQYALSNVKAVLPSIKNFLRELWSKRETGVTKQDNKIIRTLLRKVIEGITEQINRLTIYVNSYDENSKIKLVFTTDWERFLKAFPKK